MKRSTLNIAQRYAVCVALLALLPVAHAGSPGERLHVFIPASDAITSLQGLSEALMKLNQKPLVFPYDRVRFVRTSAVKCDCTLDEALKRLLSGTHLLYEINPESVTIRIDDRYCWPELGAEAPLPPCWPKPPPELPEPRKDATWL